MKKFIIILFVAAIAAAFVMDRYVLTKDYEGCYMCKGKSGTYVKYKGEDTFDKRKKAEKLGCEVGGTTSSCDAANYDVLGTVE